MEEKVKNLTITGLITIVLTLGVVASVLSTPSFTGTDIEFLATKHTNVLGDTTGTKDPAPEPATMLLFGTGLAGLAGILRKKNN
ncbi:MAG: hypothetical protein ACI8ZB_003070 [Desulforhopalus sp.]|jgi:hypothetical protein